MPKRTSKNLLEFMLLAYFLTLACLSAVAICQYRLGEATLYWGKECAERSPVDPGSPRGYQDDLTPPLNTKLYILRNFVSIGVYIWGFFVLPWWLAIVIPVPVRLAEAFLQRLLPQPQSVFFRNLLLTNLRDREQKYLAKHDFLRSTAAQIRIQLLEEAGKDH